ncbi:ankyrin repeat domain-containing protein [Kribbella solani]|uniref:Ankyrin repeat protein n=1 Tax=Kribbella solani TaxID=236067 RepID=A0A841DPT4_9ACTN|nr:hypothetical protein [Kribbella solani]MBB5981144.1 ankyrin repeat protein [Kribbella solani]
MDGWRFTRDAVADVGVACSAVMNLDGLLQCLIEADSGQLRPELCGGSYAAVVYDPESDAALLVGEASSVYAALDLFADDMATAYEDDVAEEIFEEYWDEALEDAPRVDEIQAVGRRLLALALLGHISLLDIVTVDHSNDHYLGEAPALFPGARFVCLASAAPPNHDEAYAVLEMQPIGDPTPADRALLGAADEAAVVAALDGGATIGVLDERGMAPLHHAVAHRRVDVVTALLAAGADPSQQADFGNAPQFATLDPDGTVRAAADCIGDETHWQIIRVLLAAGAPVNAGDLTGATLLDLAAAVRPYPEEAIRFLIARGGRVSRRTGDLPELLQTLPIGSIDDLQIRVNEVGLLLDAGARADDRAMYALLGTRGYSEHEVPSEILVSLVDQLLRHGAGDSSGGGRTPLDLAESWLADDKHPNYVPVVEHLRAFQQQP